MRHITYGQSESHNTRLGAPRMHDVIGLLGHVRAQCNNSPKTLRMPSNCFDKRSVVRAQHTRLRECVTANTQRFMKPQKMVKGCVQGRVVSCQAVRIALNQAKQVRVSVTRIGEQSRRRDACCRSRRRTGSLVVQINSLSLLV